jgi:hypothetical protein
MTKDKNKYYKTAKERKKEEEDYQLEKTHDDGIAYHRRGPAWDCADVTL